MIEAMKTKMIDRRVKGGANRQESEVMLDELINEVAHGDNLAMALCYEGFATERQAYKFIEATTEAGN